MDRHRDAIIEACQIVAQQEHLRVTVQEALKGAAITGASALAGGLVAGPLGLLVGSTVGSGIQYYRTRGKYRSVCDIIRNDLTSSQKQKLAGSVKRILNNIRTEDVMYLVAAITTQTSVKQAVIREIGRFLLNELNVKMI